MKTQFAPQTDSLSGTSDLESIRAIAKEAFIYGFPAVDSYATLYAQAIDPKSPSFKAPFNHIAHDHHVGAPNPDTPYSYLWMDLRAEPLVLHLPDITAPRYVAAQLIDLFTHNFAYLGTRATGRAAGAYLITGPRWKGKKPAGVKAIIPCETEIAYALYRTQLYNPRDLKNVERLQENYHVEPLSVFLKTSRAAGAPTIAWPTPTEGMLKNASLFRYLNFILTLAPTHPSEHATLARFAKIGIGAGRPFHENKLPFDVKEAIEHGISDAWQELARFKKNVFDTRKVGMENLFGTRSYLNNNYLYRYAGAKLGMHGNSREEVIYNGYFVDAVMQRLDAAKHGYALRFEKDQLPPTDAFWSLTIYDGKSQLFVANPLRRCLLNSSMLDRFVYDADGSLTLLIQPASPGKNKEPNWLPAPKGVFYMVLRNYLPKPAALSHEWTPPLLQKIGATYEH